MEPVREITERYRIGEVLASDPSLTVCTAVDASSGARVVVEVVAESRGATAGAAARFVEAVSALARLRHSSLPAVLDGGVTDDGAAFLVRESVDGRPFHTLGGESPGQILSLLLQVIGGLELLAGDGFHHGALSRDTLWVAAGPERPRAKIVGLAAGAWRSRQPGHDRRAAVAEDLRALGSVACRLLGAAVTEEGSAEPRVKLPLAVAFELEDADALRRLLERCLRADPAARPRRYSDVRTDICIALWGEAEAGLPSASGASGAPPARLNFTTVPEDSLVQAPVAVVAPPPAAPPPRDEGEITKVVLPEELEGFDGPAEDTSEVRERARRAEAAGAARPARPAPAGEAAAPGPSVSRPAAVPARRPPPAPPAGAAPPPAASPPADAALPEPDEMLTPVSFLPTGEETLSDAPRSGRATAAGTAGTVPPPLPSELGTGAGAAVALDAAPAAGEPLPAVAAPAAAAPGAGPAAAPAAAPAPAGKRLSAKAVAIAALAAGLLLALVAGGALLLWLARRGAEPVAEQAVPQIAAPVEPAAGDAGGVAIDQPPDPRLIAALERFAAGDEEEARKALAAIPAEDQAAFSAGECALVDLLGESVNRAAEERASQSLGSGLVRGDLARLRRGAAAVAGRESAFLARYPGSAPDLDRARRVLAVLDRARTAAAAGDSVEVLEQVAVLSQIFPAWEGAQGLRESAATTLEGEADAFFEQGRYDDALERLDALAAAWPERDGLTRRRELVRTRQAAERDLGRLLQAAERAAAEGRPDEGLELISGVTPPARMASRFAETRRDLERRLGELDARPPAVELTGESAEYTKDEAARISFRVTDDFRVDRVTVHARVAGEPWQVVPHSRSGGDARNGEYEVEVAPDFHRNEPIELYVTATDPSGRTGGAGSADAPIEVKRRRWFDRFL